VVLFAAVHTSLSGTSATLLRCIRRFLRFRDIARLRMDFRFRGTADIGQTSARMAEPGPYRALVTDHAMETWYHPSMA
jgi:hypothetical protein